MPGKIKRSRCPLNYGIEVFGDQWSLLLIRELILKGKRTFNELLQVDEHISTNILTSRLRHLKREGLIKSERHPQHKQKRLFGLTPRGLDLLPIIVEIGLWSDKHGRNLWEAQRILFGNRGKVDAKTRKELYQSVAKAHGIDV